MKLIKWCLNSFLILLVSGFMSIIIAVIIDDNNDDNTDLIIGIWSFISITWIIYMTYKMQNKSKDSTPNVIESEKEKIINEISLPKISKTDEYATDNESELRKQTNRYISRSKANKIPSQFLKPKKDIVDKTHYFYNKKVVITGIFNTFPRRQEMAKMLWQVGADIDVSIGKKTNAIIAGEDAGWRKLEKANDQGIEIIDEATFISYFPDYIPIFKP